MDFLSHSIKKKKKFTSPVPIERKLSDLLLYKLTNTGIRLKLLVEAALIAGFAYPNSVPVLKTEVHSDGLA